MVARNVSCDLFHVWGYGSITQRLPRRRKEELICRQRVDDKGKYTIYIQNAAAELIELGEQRFDFTPGGEGTGGVKIP